MNENERGEFALLILENGDNTYRHITATPVWWRLKDSQYEYAYGYWDMKKSEHYENLMISCQIGGITDKNVPYAWSIDYRFVTTMVDEERAGRMCKTLKRIRRGTERLEERYGHPTTYADYIIRIGQVLKVKGYVFNRENRKHKSGSAKGFVLEYETNYAKVLLDDMINRAVGAVCK